MFRAFLAPLVVLSLYALTTLTMAGLDPVEFNPEVETTFDTLDPGEVADLTQRLEFFSGEEAPDAIAIEIDKGSFDFGDVVVDDVVGTLTFQMTISPPPPLSPINGVVVADLEVTAVEDDSVEVDAIVVSVNDELLAFFEIVGQLDPTGDLFWTFNFLDLEGDDGVSVEPLDAGDFAFTGTLGGDLTLDFVIEELYVHSPDGGEVNVTTTISGTLGLESEISEVIALDDPATFIRGDVDGNGVVFPLLDALYLLSYGFNSGDVPSCLESADFDDSGSVVVLVDTLALLNWGYGGGPAAPGAGACQSDPNGDDADLGCEASTCTP